MRSHLWILSDFAVNVQPPFVIANFHTCLSASRWQYWRGSGRQKSIPFARRFILSSGLSRRSQISILSNSSSLNWSSSAFVWTRSNLSLRHSVIVSKPCKLWSVRLRSASRASMIRSQMSSKRGCGRSSLSTISSREPALRRSSFAYESAYFVCAGILS